MPVIVNELEVVVESDAPPAAAGAQQAPPAPVLSPLEVAELLERRARNELRLFAH